MALKIFISAGEASGDVIGAKLMREIRALQPDAEFFGVGGRKMRVQGLRTIFANTEIALMGFAEILPHIPRLKRRINEAAEAIRAEKPDLVVTIDSPGFSFRVISKVQDLRPQIKFVHYVAPTVWAYKPERAKKVATLYDKLLVILPFEAPYFQKEGLETKFVGHPVIEDGLDKGNAEAFRERHNIQHEFLCLMPGSRVGELHRMLPTFRKVVESINMDVAIIAADDVHLLIEAETKKWKIQPLIVDNAEKADCFAACSAGIIKSGTAGLEFAFAKKPYVVSYKINPVSAYMLRRMIRVSYVNLINIIEEKEIIPELLQEDCTPEYIADNLLEVINNADAQIKKSQQALAKLRADKKHSPSELAAKEVLATINLQSDKTRKQ